MSITGSNAIVNMAYKGYKPNQDKAEKPYSPMSMNKSSKTVLAENANELNSSWMNSLGKQVNNLVNAPLSVF